MNEKVVKAAFAQADITPEFQTSLIGCYRPDSRSQGALHRLYAQVLLFDVKGDRFCLIAIDSLGLTVALSTAIRSKIAATLHTDISHVMLNFSHTHSAPEPARHALNGERYYEFLCERIETCVEEAMGKRAPCRAGWAVGACHVGENRRDGSDLADHRLGGLMVADGKGPIAVCLRVAAHANVLMRQNDKISSDYFGPGREEIAAFFGCPVMVFQGAAGDLKPIGVEKVSGGNLHDLARVVDILMSDAKRLRFELREIDDIRMFSREMIFTADVPSKEEAEGIAAQSPGEAADDWLASCAELGSAGVKTQSLPAEINFFKLNEGCFCGVAEEIFCELALNAQERAKNPLLFLNGYTNGCTGYLPSRSEWHKGGYEVLFSNFIYHKFHGHVMPYREDTADRIVDLVVRAWEGMRK